MGEDEELGLEISAHARRRMILRNVNAAQVSAILVRGPRPIDQREGGGIAPGSRSQ
jgi:hypothetical protein